MSNYDVMIELYEGLDDKEAADEMIQKFLLKNNHFIDIETVFDGEYIFDALFEDVDDEDCTMMNLQMELAVMMTEMSEHPETKGDCFEECVKRNVIEAFPGSPEEDLKFTEFCREKAKNSIYDFPRRSDLLVEYRTKYLWDHVRGLDELVDDGVLEDWEDYVKTNDISKLSIFETSEKMFHDIVSRKKIKL